jgi:hypothetical protein
MGNAPTVGSYRFDEWDLPTKYGWMHSGAGSQAATEVQDIVDRMAERMITSGELVGRLLGGVEWAGEAASAAGRAMQRGAGQINQTAAEAATAQRCVTELGESFKPHSTGCPHPMRSRLVSVTGSCTARRRGSTRCPRSPCSHRCTRRWSSAANWTSRPTWPSPTA